MGEAGSTGRTAHSLNSYPATSAFSKSSLVLTSLDIGRVLADRDGMTFRAQGTCMYPTIRPGDVLRIQSRPVTNVRIGDIAVCRAPDYLFSHRVITKGERDGRAYLVTRPDRSHNEGDAPTFDDNLLGVVVSITRKGKRVPLRPIIHPWFVDLYFAVSLALIEAALHARIWLTNAFASLQNCTPYRHIAHSLIELASPHVSYTVRLPLNGKLANALYRQCKPDEFDAGKMWQGRAVERWTLVLHLNDARQPAAWTTFVRGADDTWCAEESYVRVRYRGAGLDDALMRQAEKILARGG